MAFDPLRNVGTPVDEVFVEAWQRAPGIDGALQLLRIPVTQENRELAKARVDELAAEGVRNLREHPLRGIDRAHIYRLSRIAQAASGDPEARYKPDKFIDDSGVDEAYRAVTVRPSRLMDDEEEG